MGRNPRILPQPAYYTGRILGNPASSPEEVQSAIHCATEPHEILSQ